ncbi:MAG TPA: hypothetical protein VNA69_15285 [Thermoanaerobaculia bacterium]|nr:hypothetical protein [Thermoanaerobaculia bacterium]
MLRLVRETIALAPLAYEERRARVAGPFYSSLRSVRAELGANETAGISMRDTRRDVTNAVFANYYLYPHRTRFFGSLDDYRVMVLVDPAHPKRLVRIDTARTSEARLMTYNEVRHEEVLETPIVRDPKPGATALTDAIVPMALAIDGQPGNAYLTDGVLLSDLDATATLTFFPTGESKTFALRARQPLVLRDVVYQITKRLDAGWLRVSATAPVRASFWFVNRGLRHAVALPLFERTPPLPQRVAGGERFWILNPNDAVANVAVDGTPHSIAPHSLTQLPARAMNEVTADRDVLAFSAARTNGRERFNFP